jgi:pimeloyl-ACP methyl ester carboxylesterase
MGVTISKDGTRIGFDKEGQGPPVLLVDGAMCYRGSGPMKPLAKLLAPHFTVYTYDRRGRGESGDTQPWSLDREVEDIAALVREAGEPVYVYGISSGAVLALEAATRGVPIRRLALYEAPLMVDDTREPLGEEFLPRLKALVAAGRRGDAVKMFMKAVGVPAIGIFVMRLMPVWKKLTAIGHTLQYDLGFTSPYQQGRPLPSGLWSGATMPSLVMDGGKSPAWMRNAQAAVARVLPHATARTLPGQNHMVSARAVAPALIEFFT